MRLSVFPKVSSFIPTLFVCLALHIPNALGEESSIIPEAITIRLPGAGGGDISMITPPRWRQVGADLSQLLVATHERYTRLLGEIPAVRSSVRLMEEQEFYRVTGAPEWTNALYLRGQIIIPLSAKETINHENLNRSAVHEFSHAIIHAVSGGRAPGWIDEGLAQWIEGPENPALQPALRSWLKKHQPLPLAMLQGGFTKLNPKVVPVAYAQSLYATHAMIHVHGFKRLGEYFRDLRDGSAKPEAFESRFGTDESEFEHSLGIVLQKWSAGNSAVTVADAHADEMRARTR
jgi:hypothetical protein